MRLVAALASAAATLVPAGCGVFFGSNVGQGVGSVGCADMPGGPCQDQADRLAARHPGARDIEITCTAPVCDRRGGSGTAVITLGNGTTVNDTFSYVGDPAPVPPPSCTGVPPDMCRSLAQGQVDGISPMKRILAIDVRCTAAVCTPDKGEADVTVRLADGSTQQGGSSWDGGTP